MRDRVAVAAAALVEHGMLVGLGTGDTAARFIERLAARVREEKLSVTCVATSVGSADLGKRLGLDVRPLAEIGHVDLAVDGADEVDPNLDLLKGGGGAQTREKIVAASATRFVVVVDEGKLVPALCTRQPVALEVVADAVPLVTRRVEALGGRATLRPSREAPGIPWRTDLGNLLLDARFAPLEAPGAPAALAREIEAIPGVLGHGIFAGMVHLVLVGDAGPEVRRRIRAGGPQAP